MLEIIILKLLLLLLFKENLITSLYDWLMTVWNGLLYVSKTLTLMVDRKEETRNILTLALLPEHLRNSEVLRRIRDK